jgi:universal stress protein A
MISLTSSFLDRKQPIQPYGNTMKISNQSKANRKQPVTAPTGFQKILVAIDFSEHSKKALLQALSLAQEYDASLCLVHVVEPASFINDLSNVAIAKPNAEVAAEAKSSLVTWAEANIPASIPVSFEVRIGKPFNEISLLAGKLKADLIVIATHGYTGLKHVMLGGTAERVVRHAPCPVLVVR